jgi:hypothetical protein
LLSSQVGRTYLGDKAHGKKEKKEDKEEIDNGALQVAAPGNVRGLLRASA